MLYAYNSENRKVTPEPKLTGKCIVCGNDMIAKCGEIVVWHWAHKVGSNECDNWYEPITSWHKGWIDLFDSDETEIMIEGDNKKEKHVIDIRTKRGNKIDLQSKRLKINELEKRDKFWGGSTWIINSEDFFKGGLTFFNNEEKSKNYAEIIEGWNYPIGISNTIKERVLASDNRIIAVKNDFSYNKDSNLIFEIKSKKESELEELKNKIIKINSEFITKCENRRTAWVYFTNRDVENFGMFVKDQKDNIVGKEFYNLEVYLDNVKGIEGWLFDVKNSKIVSREEFLINLK